MDNIMMLQHQIRFYISFDLTGVMFSILMAFDHDFAPNLSLSSWFYTLFHTCYEHVRS